MALLAASMVATAPPGDSGLTWSGRYFVELVSYLEEPEGQEPVTGGVGFDLSVTARPAEWVSLEFSPRLSVDFADETRNRVVPREIAAVFHAGPVDVNVGLLRFAWGTATFQRPTDVLNQTDFGSGFFRAEKLGDIALSTRLTFEPVRAELVFMPLYQFPTFPGGADVLGIGFGRLGALRIGARQGLLDEDMSVENMTFAARIGARLGPAELEVMWMSGPSRLPGPWLDDLTLRDVVYPVDIVGCSASVAVGPVVLKGEVAWTFSDRADLFIVAANPYPWTEPIPPTRGAYVAGAETTFWDFVADADLTLTIEYLGEVRPYRDAQALFRPWQNDLFAALTLALDDVDESRVAFAAAIDLSRGDTLLRIAAERRLIGDLTLAVDAALLIAGEAGPLDLLHTLSDRDTLRIRLDWAF